MLKNLKIGSKITLVLMAVVILSVGTVSTIAFNFSLRSLEREKLEALKVISSEKKDKIQMMLEDYTDKVKVIRNIESVEGIVNYLSETSTRVNPDLLDSIDRTIRRDISLFLNEDGVKNLFITSDLGQILFSTDQNDVNYKPGTYFNDPDGNVLDAGKDSIYFSNVFREKAGYFFFCAAPLEDTYGNTESILILQVSMEPFYEFTSDTTGLGETGEVILGRLFNNRVVYLNPLRFDEDAALRKSIYLGERHGNPIQQAVRGRSGAALDRDYRGELVFAVWDYIPDINWGLVTKIDQDEIYARSGRLLVRFIITGIVVVLLTVLIGIIFSRFLTSPVLSLKKTLEMLGNGILPDRVKKTSNDEIGEMAGLLNDMVKGFRNTAKFAQEIGEGHFDADFKPMSSDDTLGNALLQMRDSIMKAEKRDKERNWIVTGVAEIGEILRRHDQLEPLGDEVTAFITKKINAIQGAFYVVNNEQEEGEESVIEMISSYAYNKKKYLRAKFKFAQGLVGQAAVEEDTIIRTEIPQDYVTITSGILGDQRPSCILIVPMITDEKVYGVIEFAGFHRFTDKEIKFVEEVSIIIARTVFNIKVNERTRNLLSESQTMSNELQEQQEILRQNAEEMEATQEELKRTNTQLEDQIEEVNRTQKRMQLLLENASEVITIFEENRVVRYISPSVERILGYTSSEMIGEDDLQHVHEDYHEEVKKMFQELLDNPFQPVTVQYKYIRKDQEDIWVESTGTNLLSDKAIQGILMNTRDITERKRAEQEQRMRSQMQALSENSPDLITRFNTDGEVFYINPVIESYTGNKPDHFLNKNIDSVGLPDAIKDEWLKILGEVKDSSQKLNFEMDFPSPEMGDRIVQVNAIPEFGENQDLESVLVVSHDITKRKVIEMEIQSKNKKITESINYAKRIQGAILPDNQVIHRTLTDSFILYKAKDVVSGDFPWYLRMENQIFIAAVDCTGHGVPGALISLIGYFLLNDIVRSRKVFDTGEILDLLDEGVTQTLRQDQEDSKTKDGMDIAIMRIDLDNNELMYSGAHRPLYYMEDGEMNEVKGDRFPIGGGTYKNQTKFTKTKIGIKDGLSVYFCSDGFPDQFGGPDNRKFGPKRLRKLITEVHEKPMSEQYEIFNEEWEGWKADYKQTDDVLLIGIKF